MAFVQAVLEAGADGIFYASQYGSSLRISPSEYETFCRPFDLNVLEAAAAGSFNLLHIHGQAVYFDAFTDYPVQAINWHDREIGLPLNEGAQRFTGLVVGGLSQADVVEGTPAHIRAVAQEAIQATGGRRMCLSTGCVIPTVAPWGNIRAVRAAVEPA